MEIVGCCSNCRLVYSLENDIILCPFCGQSAILWASRLDEPEEEVAPWPHVLNQDATACAHSCVACAWLRRDKPEIQWLDKLFDLEDLR